MSIKYIKTKRRLDISGIVEEIYDQINSDFGAVVEPFLLHSLSPRILGGVWASCRETELVTDIVPRKEKELVASTISQINRCPYCVDAHTIMLNAEGAHEVTGLLSTDTKTDISDPKLLALHEWALSTRTPRADIILAPPFSIDEAPEIIGMAVFYHYINKMASVFLSATPLPSNVKWLKGFLKIIAGWYFSLSARQSKVSGESLKFIPMAELPEELVWAKGSPSITKAFAGFSTVIDEAGRDILPNEVRQCVEQYVHSWNGDDPGISRHWVEEAIHGLDDADKDVGRLLLTASIAPYQVDENMILLFRNTHPSDEELLGALAWGSFTVAKKIGEWLYAPFR
ncbi:MAG: alkylhydroperoxidase [Gammaproteobacteria bacterium]|nr:alkylhydroperoxidase [Gammaproteobacteria bacterium]